MQDNILVAHEVFHYFRGKNGKDMSMRLKLI